MKTKPRATDDTKSANKPQNGSPKTFKFSWDSKKAPAQSAKVFRKKDVVKPPIDTTDKQDDQSDKILNRNDNNENTIRRKRRKDKQLKRQLTNKEGVENTQSSSANNQKKHSLFSEKHKSLYVSVPNGQSLSEEVFASSGGGFADLNIHRHVVSNLEKIDFKTLTNVQEKAIPMILKGENCLIRSQTGSGKTLTYAVPIINALQGINPPIKRSDGVQALIVVPTRELALQTFELFNKINTFQWITTGVLCGGEKRKAEKSRLKKGISILIGTPGRLLDHVLHTTCFDLAKVRCLVLDEADRLLDMGFRKDIISLVERIDKAKSDSDYDPMALVRNQKTNFEEEPEPKSTCNDTTSKSILANPHSKERQTILLSATLSKQVSELADFAMKQHVYIDALEENDSMESESDFVIPNTVKQEFLVTFVKHRLLMLTSLILEKNKKSSCKILIFMASRHMVEFHHDFFTKYLRKMPKSRTFSNSSVFKGDKVVEFNEDSSDDEEEEVIDAEFFKLHGSMGQSDRKEVFRGFRSATKGVLLCTDVAARGLDIPEADCIIQYTPPLSDKDYLHRVGRTGRAGNHGSAILFLTHEEQEYLSHLQQHKVFLKEINDEIYRNSVSELMSKSNFEEAATSLQRYYESRLASDKNLTKSACVACASLFRFYNTFSPDLRRIFNFKRVNMGHYVTSFALTMSPTEVSKVARGDFEAVQKPQLNKNRKLATHSDDPALQEKKSKPKKRKSFSSVSEYSSGLGPQKKKKINSQNT